MNRRFKGFLILITVIILAGFYLVRWASAATVDEIVSRSEQVNPGLDQRSKLTFLIKEGGGLERKIVLRRFWKNYKGENGIDSKMMIFYEYPPEEKGQSFMTWFFTGRAPDRWIYLPLLRQVQKVPEKMAGGFQAIDFRPEDMAPRPVDLDSHRLLREETIDNKPYYVVETTPKAQEPNQIYGKWIKWISKDQFLNEKTEYFDRDNKPLKEQFISWKKVGPSWVWEKVMIKNIQTNAQTSLTITEVQVNSNLLDKFFTERTMKLGLEGLH